MDPYIRRLIQNEVAKLFENIRNLYGKQKVEKESAKKHETFQIRKKNILTGLLKLNRKTNGQNILEQMHIDQTNLYNNKNNQTSILRSIR